MSRRRSNWTTLCKMENLLAHKSKPQKRKGADPLLITSGTRDQNLQTLSLPVFRLFLRVYQLTGLPHRAGTETSGSSDCMFSNSVPGNKFLVFWTIYIEIYLNTILVYVLVYKYILVYTVINLGQCVHVYVPTALPGCFSGKESICQCRRCAFVPDLKRSPGGENGNPLQYSCMDIGAWWATVRWVTKESYMT